MNYTNIIMWMWVFHRKTPRIVGHVLSKRAIIIVS